VCCVHAMCKEKERGMRKRGEREEELEITTHIWRAPDGSKIQHEHQPHLLSLFHFRCNTHRSYHLHQLSAIKSTSTIDPSHQLSKGTHTLLFVKRQGQVSGSGCQCCWCSYTCGIFLICSSLLSVGTPFQSSCNHL